MIHLDLVINLLDLKAMLVFIIGEGLGQLILLLLLFDY